jgi:3-oxoacyl-[acyl-carrier protein] reductase
MPVAVITGASKGIGRAIALRLAAEYEIVAAARSRGALETLVREIDAAGGRCRPVPVDLRDECEAHDAFTGIDADVLVHNAGVGVLEPLMELTSEQWHTMIDVNINALYHVTRALVPAMLARGRGHIVLIGSVAGRNAFVGGTAYAASKAFGQAFAESLMLEVRDRGVKVSVVAPASVATGFFSEPKDWMLHPEDIADAVAYVLATPQHVTVHRMEVRATTPRKG